MHRDFLAETVRQSCEAAHVVFLVTGLSYLLSGPVLGWICLTVGVGFLVLWNHKRPPPPEQHPVIWPSDSERPSSSVVIELIREAYRHRRGE